MHSPKKLFPVLLSALALSTPAWAQSVWLPTSGQLLITPGFSYSTFDEFWVGDDKVDNPPDGEESLDQYTGWIGVEYSLCSVFALDLAFGYTGTHTDASGLIPPGTDGSDDGWMDTTIGARYLFLKESRFVPRAAVRVGGIVAGTYDEDLPFSPGDGAHGAEASILLGKTFGNTGFGAYGDIGYRVREGSVPEDVFGSAGLFKQFESFMSHSDGLTLSFGYRHVQGLDGPNIGDPGFSFPLVKEVAGAIEGAIGYTDDDGRLYQLTFAETVYGRNTGDKFAVLFTIGFPFQTR